MKNKCDRVTSQCAQRKRAIIGPMPAKSSAQFRQTTVGQHRFAHRRNAGPTCWLGAGPPSVGDNPGRLPPSGQRLADTTSAMHRLPLSGQHRADTYLSYCIVCRPRASTGPIPASATVSSAALWPAMGRCLLPLLHRLPLPAQHWADTHFSYWIVCRCLAGTAPIANQILHVSAATPKQCFN